MGPNTSARAQLDFAADNPGALRVGGTLVNGTSADEIELVSVAHADTGEADQRDRRI